MFVREVTALAFDTGMLSEQIHPVRAAPEGNFAQGGQVLDGKDRKRFVLFGRLLSGAALQQLLGLNIDKLNLICLIEYGIRYPILLGYSGYGSHLIVQAFDMLHIDSGVNVDPCLQKLLYVLIAFDMAASVRVCMGQVIQQDQLRAPLKGRVDIKLAQSASAAQEPPDGKLFQPL